MPGYPSSAAQDRQPNSLMMLGTPDPGKHVIWAQRPGAQKCTYLNVDF